MPPLFDYNQSALIPITTVSERDTDGIRRKLIVFTTDSGIKRAAELLRPAEDSGSHPAILYLHWYEPNAPDSNRSQFREEAKRMVDEVGAVCLMVETLWSDIDFFVKRTQADDREASIRQVIEIRQAMDILLSEPGVDAGRVALVGHDFGAMYGAVMGGVDSRPTAYVLMAGTPRFPDWYLYYPAMEGQAREDFIASFADLDPIMYVPNLGPTPVFFQFGDTDPHVSGARSKEFYAAASEPKSVKYYPCGHGLNDAARQDRIAWLKERLAPGD